MKKLTWVTTLIVATLVGGAGLAAASCGQSSIAVAAMQRLFEPTVTVTWRIEPTCDVIESGVLLGNDRAALTPIGQPIYGYRATYQQEIPVIESGLYWIGAYAKDESGNVSQSASHFVIVAIPPQVPIESQGGSHGAPPSYTGTDDDFLRPAGEPHFASLKNLTLLDSGHSTFGSPAFGFIEDGSARRAIASTHRDEVLTRQSEPVQVGPRTISFPTAAIGGALDRLDRFFKLSSFPRTGLYAVQCSASFSFFDFCNEIFPSFHLSSSQSTSELIIKRTGVVSRGEGSSVPRALVPPILFPKNHQTNE